MKKIAFVLLIIILPFITQAQGWFTGVGHLPGTTYSKAYTVSANGKYVGGNSGTAFVWLVNDDSLFSLGSGTGVSTGISNDGIVAGIGSQGGTIAFRWIQDSGWVNLGNLGFSPPESEAHHISEDGSVIVGWSYSPQTKEAFKWTEGSGMISLGLLPGGYQHEAVAVSGDGLLAVGSGRNGDNNNQAILWNGGVSALPFLVDSFPNSSVNASWAFDISSDGSTIVGGSYYKNETGSIWFSKAVIWPGASKPIELPLLPGYESSIARAVSGDGSIIVGSQYLTHCCGEVLAIWDSTGQPRILREYLETDYGMDLGDWVLMGVSDISANGRVIVGWGTNPDGQTEGWAANLGLVVTKPSSNEKFIAGQKDTIKWSGISNGSVVQIEYSIDGGNNFEQIDYGIPINSGMYVWDVPDTILSTKCQIKVFDMLDTNIVSTSYNFRIKPYLITKLDEDGNYVAYNELDDRWGFGNDSSDVWPYIWWQRFDYEGTDPFTGSDYSYWQGDFVFPNANSSDFPDWEAFVRAFTIDACYVNTFLGRYSPTALAYWESKKGEWDGSCFGIAGTNALAFSNREGFSNKFSSFPSFSDPITVVADEDVIPVITEVYIHQFGVQSKSNDTLSYKKTPTQTVNDLKQMLIEDSVDIKNLTIYNNNGVGSHTILPYRLNQDSVQENIYYIEVYDNGFSNSTEPIKVDTADNGGNGSWTTIDWEDWGGEKGIYLELDANIYLEDAILPSDQYYDSPFILSENIIEIDQPSDLSIIITDNQGNSTGYSKGTNTIFDQIPNSFPLSFKNGNETPPYGYLLETDNYSVKLNEFAEETVETYFFTGNKTFTYKRDGAEQNQTDRLFFDGGLSASNPDVQIKTIQLLNIINETIQEKLTSIRSIELAENDSVKIENPDSNTTKLISYGSAKNYDIELNYITESSLGRFGDFNVQLSENTTHTFVPEWTNINNTNLMVLVDNGNNGTIDDTLFLQNQVSGIEGDQGSLLNPNNYNLTQNYPNPFNPITAIQYSIPKRSNVVLKVFDILGNEVATLVNAEKDRGVYTVTFDGGSLASGMYLYRLQAENFIETKKMILMK